MKYKRIFAIVVDSFGIGAAPDAFRYGDEGCDTLGHIDERMDGLRIPVLRRLGLESLHPLKHRGKGEAAGYCARLSEASAGKDTMTGHWEMMGLLIPTPFQTFTETGFPAGLIQELERRTGRRVIGNRAASGTEILEELGEQADRTGEMIVYTSADSVLQICGSEERFGLQELYRCCEIARELTLREEWKVGRVIARPYVRSTEGTFQRTSNRRDYALKPFGKTVLDSLKQAGFSVIGVGKIHDIFDGEGLTDSLHSQSSVHGMEQTLELAEKDFTGLCYVNLVDFDALWGHRRNPAGYGEELERFDEKLEELVGKLRPDDLLMVTADHGNDPTFRGTDHTREDVPLLMVSPSMIKNGRLPNQDSFAAVGATIADNFGVSMPPNTIGTSLLACLI